MYISELRKRIGSLPIIVAGATVVVMNEKGRSCFSAAPTPSTGVSPAAPWNPGKPRKRPPGVN